MILGKIQNIIQNITSDKINAKKDKNVKIHLIMSQVDLISQQIKITSDIRKKYKNIIYSITSTINKNKNIIK